jgi:iodotyrosine deiodinase
MKQSKTINGYPYISYTKETFGTEEMEKRSSVFFDWLDSRRSVREFSSQPIPKNVIDNIVMSASTAPSGAHKQPWTICIVENPDIKKQIRIAAEQEEKESYDGRMSETWLNDLAPLGTRLAEAIFRNCTVSYYCIQKKL